MEDTKEHSDFSIIRNALDHFSKRLLDLQKDDVIKVGNVILTKDLEVNAARAKELGINLIVNKSAHTIIANRDLICNALTLYADDLRASKNGILDKLTANKKAVEWFTSEHIDNEIAAAESASNVYCR